MSTIPEQLKRNMRGEYLARLMRSVGELHELFLFHGIAGLKDLRVIFPLDVETMDRTEMDDFLVPIISFLRQKYKKQVYEESLDLDPLE